MGRHPNKIRCNWLLDRFVANPLTLTADHTPLSALSLLFYFKRWFRYMKSLVIVRWNLLRNPSFALTFLNFELGLFLSMWFCIEFSQKGSPCCFVFFCVCVRVCFLGVWDDEDSVKKTSIIVDGLDSSQTSIIVQRNAWCSLRLHHASIGLGLPGFFGATEDESRNIGWLYHLVWLNDSLVYTNVIWVFFFFLPYSR